MNKDNELPETLDQVHLSPEEKARYGEDFVDRAITSAMRRVKASEERRHRDRAEIWQLRDAVFADWLLETLSTHLEDQVPLRDAIRVAARLAEHDIDRASVIGRVLEYGATHDIDLGEFRRFLQAYDQISDIDSDTGDEEIERVLESFKE